METINKTITLLIFLLPLFSFSQKVENIRFEQTGKQIHIYYDLDGDETYTVQVFCSTDNGQSWGEPLKYLTGAVGENQIPGKGKMMVWDVLSEREKLSGDIRFKLKVSLGNIGAFTDNRDGQTYKWVKIGTQVWMAENLNYRNGKGSYCYNKMNHNCDRYGRLYEWRKAVSACPHGWHLPSDAEWKRLEIEVGVSLGTTDLEGWRGINEGDKLKSKEGWNDNKNGIDFYEFTALPGGYLYEKNKFKDLGRDGNWWTGTSSGNDNAWARGLFIYESKIRRHQGNKNDGFSLRCVKD